MTNDRHWADRALESGQKAVSLNPDLVVARVKLGEIYSDSGRVDDAIREHLKALEISPGNAEAYRMLGLELRRRPLLRGGSRLQEAVKRRPTDWEGRLLLGIFYYQRGRYAEAKAAYEGALEPPITNWSPATWPASTCAWASMPKLPD
ncbi:MAG: tetratricopeptide repeat protein [Paludibaculum sp.]